MKKLVKTALLSGLLLFGVTSATQAQIFVRVRPSRPVVVVNHPAAPSRAHVWVDEEWVPSGKGYAWHGGYWAAPPRVGAVYVRGHWRHSARGHVWVAGYWR